MAIVLSAVLFGVTPRGSALQKRLRDREKEMEADERDRKREKEELEEIRQRLLDEGHPDPDAELRRVRLSVTISITCMCLRSCLPRASMLSVVFVKVTSSCGSLCIGNVQLSLSTDLVFCKYHYLLSAYPPLIGPDGGGRGGASETAAHYPRTRARGAARTPQGSAGPPGSSGGASAPAARPFRRRGGGGRGGIRERRREPRSKAMPETHHEANHSSTLGVICQWQRVSQHTRGRVSLRHHHPSRELAP